MVEYCYNDTYGTISVAHDSRQFRCKVSEVHPGIIYCHTADNDDWLLYTYLTMDAVELARRIFSKYYSVKANAAKTAELINEELN